MRLERLTISNIRNVATLELDLNPKLNLLWGPNGAGKTAILEAVFLLSRGRSFRSGRTSSVIQTGCSALTVRAEIEDELHGHQSLAISRSSGGLTQLRIGGSKERLLSRMAELLPLQLMLPDVSSLVFGSPGDRRRWLDWGMFHVEPHYLAQLRGYLRSLKQRNAALKSRTTGSDLDVWTQQLESAATPLTEARRRYVNELQPFLAANLRVLAPELEVEAAFYPGWTEGERLSKVLVDHQPREVKLGLTQYGPQRADVRLLSDGQAARLRLSRGQGKVLASALKISQANLLRAKTGRSSLFLIDDVGAELDAGHSVNFFRLLGDLGCQILATATDTRDRDLEGVDVTRFHVEQGEITSGE